MFIFLCVCMLTFANCYQTEVQLRLKPNNWSPDHALIPSHPVWAFHDYEPQNDEPIMLMWLSSTVIDHAARLYMQYCKAVYEVPCLNQNIQQSDKINTDETSVPVNDQGFHDPGTKTRPQWTGSCAQMNISSGFWISNMSTLKSALVSNPANLKHWTDLCKDRSPLENQKQLKTTVAGTYCNCSW